MKNDKNFSNRRSRSNSKRPTNDAVKPVRSKTSQAPVISKLVLLNKPFNTLCQFSGEEGDITLAKHVDIKGVYPAGRLDKDSEGLLLLTNDGKLQHKISHPKHKMEKAYWVQVEGEISERAILTLGQGVELRDGKTKPAKAKVLDLEIESQKEFGSALWKREPAVRFRKNIPTSWIELKIKEGKNRQVRRMTAAVGFPTLRLIRISIGKWHLKDLQPGQYKVED